MITDNPSAETTKLIRCHLVNTYKEQTVRLIEFENFRLWEYLMTNKHGAIINNISLTLWINEDNFKANEELYSRTGDAEEVNRIIVDLYDEEYGFTTAITRFVRSSETDQVKDILSSHIPKELSISNDCHIQVIKGFSITQPHHPSKRPMIMGLED